MQRQPLESLQYPPVVTDYLFRYPLFGCRCTTCCVVTVLVAGRDDIIVVNMRSSRQKMHTTAASCKLCQQHQAWMCITSCIINPVFISQHILCDGCYDTVKLMTEYEFMPRVFLKKLSKLDYISPPMRAKVAAEYIHTIMVIFWAAGHLPILHDITTHVRRLILILSTLTTRDLAGKC